MSVQADVEDRFFSDAVKVSWGKDAETIRKFE